MDETLAVLCLSTDRAVSRAVLVALGELPGFAVTSLSVARGSTHSTASASWGSIASGPS